MYLLILLYENGLLLTSTFASENHREANAAFKRARRAESLAWVELRLCEPHEGKSDCVARFQPTGAPGELR
jgi:hypothetical protein